VDALIEAEIASSGVAESFRSVSNVVRTGQAHQATASSLFKILKTACENQSDEEESLDVSVNSLGAPLGRRRFLSCSFGVQS